MASYLSLPSTLSTLPHKKPRFKPSNHNSTLTFIQNPQNPLISNSFPSHNLTFNQNPCPKTTPKSSFSSSNTTFLENNLENNLEKNLENDETLVLNKESPVKFIFWVFVWASVSVALFAFSPSDAKAQVQGVGKSIKASSFGLKFANFLRGSGWPDEAVVFALATLPIIELRGAIPVGYWLQIKPVVVTALSVLGNMVPVPFIILYIKPLATFLAGTNKSASRFLDLLFEKAKRKAGPIEEFQWLGLMLFVAVPFPGTGAWTGAIIASILDMPFWSAVSANFCGVVLAGLLVNMLVNIGLKYAVVACILMFIASGFMWSILRFLKQRLSSSSSC